MSSAWLEWARSSGLAGFAAGSHRLVRPASYYDEAFVDPAPWRKSSARDVVYLPAAVQCAIAGGPFFEIGCGPGVFAQLLLEMSWGTHKHPYAMGTDTSPVAIDHALATVRARFLVAHKPQLERLLRYVTYRTVVMVEVLEHVYEDLSMVAMIPVGKRVVISVPSSISDGHCRWFGSLDQAASRYRPLIHWHDGIETKAGKSDNRWYIMRGVRR